MGLTPIVWIEHELIFRSIAFSY